MTIDSETKFFIIILCFYVIGMFAAKVFEIVNSITSLMISVLLGAIIAVFSSKLYNWVNKK